MNPLVSVPVVTYNSSKTILECLESIKYQTYWNLELIISDDASTDNTVQLCEDWLSENRFRFSRCLLIKGDYNVGISSNSNRAQAQCTGEWIKGLAGDDMLFPDCIEKFVRYVSTNKDAVYIFGKIRCFGGNRKQRQYYEKKFNESFFSVPADNQYDLLMRGQTPSAPTLFYNRKKSIELGVTNDERIPLMEDLPKWVNLYRKGVRFHFLNEYVVKYRLGGISTTSRWNDWLGFRNLRLFWFHYVFSEMYEKDPRAAIESAVDYEVKLMLSLKRSRSYRIGEFLLKPIKKILSNNRL